MYCFQCASASFRKEDYEVEESLFFFVRSHLNIFLNILLVNFQFLCILLLIMYHLFPDYYLVFYSEMRSGKKGEDDTLAGHLKLQDDAMDIGNNVAETSRTNADCDAVGRSGSESPPSRGPAVSFFVCWFITLFFTMGVFLLFE